MFTQDLRVIHVRDLNFILSSEIFVHWDGQLRVSHLILSVELVYSTWQPFKQALLVNSPLLSYIDVRHANFLPPRFTVGEARDLGWRYTSSNELAPLQDVLVERVSQRLRELAHALVESEAPVQEALAQPDTPVESKALVQEAKQVATESINSFETESDRGEDMVTIRTMTIDRFVPGARQTA